MNATVLLLLALSAGEHIRSAKQAYDSGISASAERDWPVAERSLLKAIDIEPTYVQAYRSLIDIYVRTNRPVDAGAMLTRLLQIEPNSVQDRIQLGRLLIEGREWRRALAQFSVARKLAPQDPNALFGFAVAASKDGRDGMTAAAIDALKLGSSRFSGDKRFTVLLKALETGETAGSKR